MDKVLMPKGDYLSLQFSDMAKEETTPKPVMIAMKGHPGTGKSTLAHSLASTLKIPLIDKDDIRDCTLLLHQSLPSASYSLLNDLSYHAIYQIASTQLRLGLSVVIDSPLSRPTHLQRLLHIASSAGAHLVILECKPSDEAKWQERLERRGKSEGASWHKPATWQELEMLVQGYGGCTDYDVGDVPRMVVDTTAPVSVEEHVSRVINFIVSRCGTCVGL